MNFANAYIYIFYCMTYMAKEGLFSNQRNNLSNQVVKVRKKMLLILH